MQWRRMAIFVAAAVAALIVIAGCSRGVDNQTSDLTKEEQYDEIAPFIDMMISSASLQFGGAFWDGVSEEDIQTAPLEVPGLGKPVASNTESISVVYNPVKGWWFISAELSETDSLGTMTILISDSVRFETAAGDPQIEPDETTDRFRHGGSLSFDWLLDGDSVTLDFSVTIASHADVSGINTPTATAVGATTASMGIEADTPEGSGSFVFDVSAAASNIQMNTSDGGDACPYDGTLALDMSVDIDVTEDGNHLEASGDWDVAVEFIGGGRAAIVIDSDDFHLETEETVCPTVL